MNQAERMVLNLLHSRKVTANEAADLIDAIRAQIDAPKGRLLLSSSIRGRGERYTELQEDIASAASCDGPVMVDGETGTGKMMVARTIHYNSRRSERPFLSLDCTEEHAEEELCGVEAKKKGETVKRGLLDLARGGTLVLDMIVELAPTTQEKLYAFIQTGQFKRIGGTRTESSDVRIIGACQGLLEDQSGANQLNPDLVGALRETTIHTYTLNESPESIPDLVKHFVSVQAHADARVAPGVSDDLIQKLVAHDWKMNHSELAGAIRTAVSGFKGDVLTADDVELTAS